MIRQNFQSVVIDGQATPPRAGFLLNQCYNSSSSTHPMSEEQLKAFLEKVQGDTSLQEKLKAAADANAVAAIAKEAGFSISADDINKTQSELSDEELEGVAGGRSDGWWTWLTGGRGWEESGMGMR